MSKVSALSQVTKSLVNSNAKPLGYNLDTELSSALIAFGELQAESVKVDELISQQGLKLHDLVISKGFTKDDFPEMRDNKDPEKAKLREQVINSIVLGFERKSPEYVGLYYKDNSTLSLKKQGDKSFLAKKVRDAYNNFKKAVERKENKPKGNAQAEKSSNLEMSIKELGIVANRLGKEEYAGVVEHIKVIKKLIADIKPIAVIKK